MSGKSHSLEWRLARKILVGDGCWEWTGAVSGGYGSMNEPFGSGFRRKKAHRVVYEWLVGPIPEGLDLDHVCHNGTACPGGAACVHRRCVRPSHLEPVTRSVNLQRSGHMARSGSNPRSTA